MTKFEVHITTDPVFDEELEKFKTIATKHKFKVAKLLMQKSANSSTETSELLKESNFKLRRFKIKQNIIR